MKKIGKWILAAVILVAVFGLGVRANTESYAAKNELQPSEETAVVNNGGEFVRVGSRVYFRKFLFDESSSLGMNGDYRASYDGNIPSIFGYIDDKDGVFHKLFDDRGQGKIFFFGGRFYLSRYSEKATEKGLGETYSVNMNGADERVIAEGRIQALDPKTKSFVVNDIKNGLRVYRGEPGQKPERQLKQGEYHAIVDGHLIYSESESDEQYRVILKFYDFDLSTGKEPVLLGAVKEEEAMGSFITVKSIQTAENKLWIGVEYLQGSGMFFQAGEIHEAMLGKKNSLKRSVKYEGDAYELPSFAVQKGKPVFYDLTAGELDVRGGAVYFNASNQKHASDRKVHQIYASGKRSLYGGVSENIEVAERVGDQIYFVRNRERLHYVGGTRWSYYQLVNTEYLCYDISKKKLRSVFGVLPCKVPVEALIWLSEDASDNGKLLFEQVKAVTVHNKRDLKLFYGIEEEELAEKEGVMAGWMPYANVAKISPKLQFEYLMLGKDGRPVGVKDGGFKDFVNVMRTRRKATAKFVKQDGDESYEIPRSYDEWKGQVYVALYFDETGETVVRIEEIEKP